LNQIAFDSKKMSCVASVTMLVAGDRVVGFSYEAWEWKGESAERGAQNSERLEGQNGVPRSELRDPRLIDLFAPRALVCTFDAECGNPYGCALLARAYPAWFEKWMTGGAKRTLRLRMIKDAYIGDIIDDSPPLPEISINDRFFLTLLTIPRPPKLAFPTRQSFAFFISPFHFSISNAGPPALPSARAFTFPYFFSCFVRPRASVL